MSDTITVSSDTVTIAAPAQLVWDVLVDFARYPQWNQFCPSIEATLEVGSPVVMKVDLGQGLQDQVEYITLLEPPRKITWSMENNPGDPIHADRSQVVEPVDEDHCTYVTYDIFSGEAAQQMVEMLGAPVEQGFKLCAQNLKARAEALYAQQRGTG
ncbi:SRPBCC domain-containing protein [Pseudohalioglobus lutimaris]|uniref:SRPBCC domain-containing protein n=1 Tax=Pseudohalioglobus lutimaris TaxID=1737061 RepID=A0A2N5WWU9_9GAMM|nr:SRPBCC domain-containing protein [Pseudohalioglobus lutimaris]PLW66706.1 SRPBCC domain-containing protein [Pseudohalioglobus lutimaris]